MGRYSFQERFHRNEPMTQDEAVRMINEAQTPALSALFAILYLYGPRISEAMDLQKRDFTVLKTKLQIRMPTRKTRDPDSYRILKVPLTAPGMEKIVTFLSINSSLDDKGKVFRFSKRTAQRKIRALNPNTSAHWFRHTRATRFAEISTDQYAIQAWFGWRDPRTPLHYIQLSPKIADRLSDTVD